MRGGNHEKIDIFEDYLFLRYDFVLMIGKHCLGAILKKIRFSEWSTWICLSWSFVVVVDVVVVSICAGDILRVSITLKHEDNEL